MTSPAKIGIMGGTFDPIHIGHLRIAEEVREALGLDRVLFVPTGNPVFKRDQQVTDAEKRFADVKVAVADNPFFEASRIEVDRPGDTFTVDTLRELRAAEPDAELYFIVGSDVAETIAKWRAVEEIAELAYLAVAVGRPGFAQAEELRASILAAAPFRLHLVEVSALEVSSSDIRARLAAGKSVRYLVPPELLAPAPPSATGKAEGPVTPVTLASLATPIRASAVATGNASQVAATGNDSRVAPGDEPSASAALTDDFFEARKAELATRVKPKRFKHIMGVAETCEKLARRYGLDESKARLAGLLHDWDKGMDDDEARARVRELGMTDQIDPWVVENMPRVLHGETAAVALGREFPEIPADVLQAISRHTTAAEDMSPLDMALYIADAIEPGRKFGRIDELRAAAETDTLEELYFKTYEYWVFLLFERGQPLHPDTIRIWNSHALAHPRKHKRKKEKRQYD